MADIKVRLDLKPVATSFGSVDTIIAVVDGKIKRITPTQTKELVEKLTGLRLIAEGGVAKLQYLDGSSVWQDSGTEWPY